MRYQVCRRVFLSNVAVSLVAGAVLGIGGVACRRREAEEGKASVPTSAEPSVAEPSPTHLADGPPPQRYTFVELQTLPGQLYGDIRAIPTAVNASGHVVGELRGGIVENHLRNQACQWGPDGVPVDLYAQLPAGVSPGDSSACGINAAGVVVGYGPCLSSEGAEGNTLYRWENGRATEIQKRGKGMYNPTVQQINDREQILASFPNSLGSVLIEPNGTILRKDDLAVEWGKTSAPDKVFSSLFYLNNNNQGIAWARATLNDTKADPHVYLWDKNKKQATELPSLFPEGLTAVFLKLNDQRQVLIVAASEGTPSGSLVEIRSHARSFLWEAGHLIDLGVLPPATFATDHPSETVPTKDSRVVMEAVGLNARGQVAGTCRLLADDIGEHSHAVLWQEGILYELNNALLPGSPWVLRDVTAIGDGGHIVGSAQQGNRWFGYLLIPQPG